MQQLIESESLRARESKSLLVTTVLLLLFLGRMIHPQSRFAQGKPFVLFFMQNGSVPNLSGPNPFQNTAQSGKICLIICIYCRLDGI